MESITVCVSVRCWLLDAAKIACSESFEKHSDIDTFTAVYRRSSPRPRGLQSRTRLPPAAGSLSFSLARIPPHFSYWTFFLWKALCQGQHQHPHRGRPRHYRRQRHPSPSPAAPALPRIATTLRLHERKSPGRHLASQPKQEQQKKCRHFVRL